MNSYLPDGRRLILASTSPFRRELLERLGLPFQTLAPQVDESPLPDEPPQELALRLAENKARSIAEIHAKSLVIGSDQVAVSADKTLGKPGDHEHARIQLRQASGKTVTFYTGLCVIDSDSTRIQRDVVLFRVVFRRLTKAQIERYLRREQPYQCAGSFKSEGLGIALFERLEGEDPNSLIGLPLIRLVSMLSAEGVAII